MAGHEALREHGPCPEHRFSYVNVRGALVRETAVDDGEWECVS
jgi:hypothetical protein